MTIYLLRPGELTLKGGNRKSFEVILCRNLASMIKGTGAKITQRKGRFYVHCPPPMEEKIEEALGRLIGIAGWAKTRTAEKTIEAITAACIEEGKILFEKGMLSFKIEARRTDKSFPLNSYQIQCATGEAVLREVPGLKVNVHKPDAVIRVEIRENVFIYGSDNKGRHGLPVGSAGKGLLLLSGGIDSPVAGYMMASRGMRLEAIYFHAYPYTSEKAREKTVKLAEIMGRYTQGIRLHVVSFTAIQIRIKEKAPVAWRTVLLRMAMMIFAEKLAIKRGIKCLINGESLSQVASQTIENISCTQTDLKLPVLRPLIGMNKQEIIDIAQQISTYETSILPYEDCCVLFSPPHPIIKGNPEEAKKLFAHLEADSLMEEALETMEVEYCSFPTEV